MIRRRTETERAVALLRRLNEPKPARPRVKRGRGGYVWPEHGAVAREFFEAQRRRA